MFEVLDTFQIIQFYDLTFQQLKCAIGTLKFLADLWQRKMIGIDFKI